MQKNRGPMTRHHLIPKDRKKKKSYKENQTDLHLDAVLKLWRDKHTAWHVLFQNMTIDEIIECMQRIRLACIRKQAQIRTGKTIPMKDSYVFPIAK